MVINMPEAEATDLPKPCTARLKIVPHITEVHKPERARKQALSGTFCMIFVSSGQKMAAKTRTLPADDTVANIVRDE